MTEDVTAAGRTVISKAAVILMTYLNGDGCPIFADVRILPMVAEVFTSPARNLADYAQAFSHRNEAAEPRFHSVALGSVSSRQR